LSGIHPSGRSADDQPEAAPDIRVAMTYGVPVFPPMVFYAALADDRAVELLDLDVDLDYRDQSANDPS
jgi:hypothetical protein